MSCGLLNKYYIHKRCTFMIAKRVYGKKYGK